MFGSIIASVTSLFGAKRKQDDQRKRAAYQMECAALNAKIRESAARTPPASRSWPAGVSATPTSSVEPLRDTTVSVTDDGFTASLIAGYATNNVGLGYALGGNYTGAMLGEALRPDPTPACDTSSSYSSSSDSSSSSYDSGSSSSYDSGSCSSSGSDY